MNIFHFNLLFQAWRTRSVTLSLVFALAMQGIWAGVYMREFFRSIGLFWFQVWILPFVVVWIFAKFEPRLLPSEKLRRWLSILLIIGSLTFGGVLLRLNTKDGKSEDRAAPSKTNAKPDRFKGLGTKAGRN